MDTSRTARKSGGNLRWKEATEIVNPTICIQNGKNPWLAAKLYVRRKDPKRTGEKAAARS